MYKQYPVVLVVGVLSACGGEAKETVDAAVVKVPDAAPDASPDAAKVYDFSCANNPEATTAPPQIIVSGIVRELAITGPAMLGNATIDVFPTGATAPVGTVMSDPTSGAWMTGALDTGMVAFDGVFKSSKDGYRTTFAAPPQKLGADYPDMHILMFSLTNWDTLDILASAQQDDSTNGAFMVFVNDCANTPIVGATVNVTQGGNPVGTKYDLGQLDSKASGLYLTFNVPAGPAQLTVTSGNMTFPSTPRVLTSVAMQGGVGALTYSLVRPGPL